MPINSTNPTPRSLNYLKSVLPAGDDKFVLMDIGARGGIASTWNPLSGLARFIGFEPDEDECLRLNQEQRGVEFVPFALASSPGNYPFYLTELEYCHGFKASNEKFLGRFPNAINNAVKSQVEMKADALDNIIGRLGINHLDFIKIDTEGSELDILRGSIDSLRSRSTLGLLVEVWWDPRIKNQPSFSELDSFIRGQGFTFFDLECQRYPRSSLPVGHLKRIPSRIKRGAPVKRVLRNLIRKIRRKTHYVNGPAYRDFGQMLTGDALYFRDPIWDMGQNECAFAWTDESILRLVGLLDLYNYQDFAIEILDFYRDKFKVAIDVDFLLDSLVPPVDGAILPFDEYWELSARLFAKNILLPHLRPKLHLTRPKYRDK